MKPFTALAIIVLAIGVAFLTVANNLANQRARAWKAKYVSEITPASVGEAPFRIGAITACKLVWENPGIYTNSQQVADAAWALVLPTLTNKP